MRFIIAAFLVVFVTAAASMAMEGDKKDKSYVACGCGCCGGEAVSDAQCVADEAALQKIIQQDKQFSQSHNCAVIGCSKGQKYKVCKKQ